MALRNDLEMLVNHPVVDPARGYRVSGPWLRALVRAVGAVQITGTGTIWSEVNGVREWRPLAALLIPGLVRQVVVGTTAIAVINATNVYAATGLSATITPTDAGSSIIAIVTQNGCQKDTGDTSIQLKLRRNGVDIAQLADGVGGTGSAATNKVGTIAGMVSDAPGLTTPVTYDTRFASKANLANAQVQALSEVSSLMLMEVLL